MGGKGMDVGVKTLDFHCVTLGKLLVCFRFLGEAGESQGSWGAVRARWGPAQGGWPPAEQVTHGPLGSGPGWDLHCPLECLGSPSSAEPRGDSILKVQ